MNLYVNFSDFVNEQLYDLTSLFSQFNPKIEKRGDTDLLVLSDSNSDKAIFIYFDVHENVVKVMIDSKVASKNITFKSKINLNNSMFVSLINSAFSYKTNDVLSFISALEKMSK